MAKIFVKESEITILSINESDYISLTDIARHKSDDSFIVINNWMRNRNTIEYLGMWETLFNPCEADPKGQLLFFFLGGVKRSSGG